MPSLPDFRERRIMWAIIALHGLLISLPYLWAWLICPPGFVYGGLLYNPDDQNVHLAWAKQAQSGGFFFRDLFTTESPEQRPLFTNAFCWAMGALSALTRIPLIGVYHTLRLLFAALALWGFHRLCAQLSDDRRVRLTALALAAFGSGMGFLVPLLPHRTFIDRPDGPLMMPEAFTFTSAFIFPLYIASMALLVLIWHGVLRAREANGLHPALGAFGAALVLGNIHTYDVLPLGVALVVWEGWNVVRERRRPNLATALALLGMMLPLAYQFVVFQGSEEFRIKAQTKTYMPFIPTDRTPNFGDYAQSFLTLALSYGPLLLLALVGAWQLRRDRRASAMTLWVLVTLAAIYTPVSFARKMIEGLHLPLCFLAASGLIGLMVQARAFWRRAVAGGLVAVMSLSSLSFIGWCLTNAQDNNRSRAQVFMPPLFVAQGDWDALRFLEAQPRDNRAVLSLPFLSNYVPRETGRAVYTGHWAETLNYGEKLGQAARFYGLQGQMPPDEARAWLRDNRIGWVIVGSYETQLGARLPLPLRAAHNANGTAIFAVP